MKPKSKVRMIALAGLLAGLAHSQAWGQEGGQVPDWKPSEARLSELGDEAGFEGWAVRPPRGYEHRVTPGGNETRYLWGKQGEGSLVVIEADVDPGNLKPEQALQAYLDLLKGRMRGLNATPIERGMVDGKPFLRTRFSAEGIPGVPGQGFGFIYQTFEGKKPVVITGAGTADAIEKLEAAALTFRLTQ